MRQSARGAVLALPFLLATLAVPSIASAQDAPPPPPPPPPAAPPAYAPPAPQAAPAAPAPPVEHYYAPPAPPAPYGRPAPAPQGRTEEVRFEPDDPDLALMMRSGEVPVQHISRFRHVWYYERGFAPLYSPVCDGPCTTRLMPGEYHLALSRSGGRSVPAGSVYLQGPSTVHGYYNDKSGLRVLGGVIGIGGLIGGIVMVVASVNSQTICDDTGNNCYQRETTNGPLLGGGIAVIVGSVIVGSILAAQRDTAEVTISPLTLPAVGQAKESPVAALAGEPPPQGAAVTVHF